MFYFLGLFISVGVLGLAAFFLEQNPLQFFDNVAFVVVLGGTLSVIVSTKPPYSIKTIINLLMLGIKNENKRNLIIEKCSDYIINKNVPQNPKRLDEMILTNGHDLIQLRFSKVDIERILNLKIQVYADSALAIAYWVKSLAKYPPAFGLAGTVLGLIHLMRSLSESSSPAQTGVLMSIALLATLYGIILSNFVIAPLGERVKLIVDEEVVNSEMAMQTILMSIDKTNLLVAQENLDQFLVLGSGKVDLISGNVAQEFY